MQINIHMPLDFRNRPCEIFFMSVIGKVLTMRLGYVRPSPWYTSKRQLGELTAAGVDPERVYVEGRDGESLTEALRVLQSGDDLCVSTADRLVNDRRLIAVTLDDVHARGAVIVDVSSGERSTGYRFALDAIAGLARDRGTFDSKSARAARAKGGGRPKHRPYVSLADARRIWRDLTVSTPDALMRIGCTSSWAYRNLGSRGVKAGRPRNKK